MIEILIDLLKMERLRVRMDFALTVVPLAEIY